MRTQIWTVSADSRAVPKRALERGAPESGFDVQELAKRISEPLACVAFCALRKPGCVTYLVGLPSTVFNFKTVKHSPVLYARPMPELKLGRLRSRL